MSNSNWTSRFGTLKSVTSRKTAKGDAYITFELACKGFTQIGASFDEAVIKEMKANEGKDVWTAGVLDERTLADGRTVKSYKAMRIKISEDA